MFTWTQSTVSILGVSKSHTDGHVPTKGQGTPELPTQKVSLHFEETRDLQACMISSPFGLLMLQILSPPLPKWYFQVFSKILLPVLAREEHVHILELVGLTHGGQKPFLSGTQYHTSTHENPAGKSSGTHSVSNDCFPLARVPSQA